MGWNKSRVYVRAEQAMAFGRRSGRARMMDGISKQAVVAAERIVLRAV